MKHFAFFRLGILAVGLSTLLMSCGEEGILGGNLLGDGDHEENFFSMFNEADSVDLSCAEFVYPITLNNADGSTTTINNESEFDAAIQTALTNQTFPTIAFPIQVIGEDDLPVTVSTDEELCDIFMECFDMDWDDDWDDDCECDDYEEFCFEINYPITLVMPDGSQVIVNDDEELETAIDNYYDANPNDTNDVSVVYPITVTMLEDSSVVTVNNDDELDDLFEDCFDDGFEDCFDFQFPLTISYPDGSTMTANSWEELDSLFEAWEIANPNDTLYPDLVYPVTVVYEDGTTATANDEDELEELFEDCYGDDYCDMVGNTEDLVLGSSEAVMGRIAIKKHHIKEAKARKNRSF